MRKKIWYFLRLILIIIGISFFYFAWLIYDINHGFNKGVGVFLSLAFVSFVVPLIEIIKEAKKGKNSHKQRNILEIHGLKIYELISVIGIFLIVIGSFLPWYCGQNVLSDEIKTIDGIGSGYGMYTLFFAFVAIISLVIGRKINKRRFSSIINLLIGLIVSIITAILIEAILTFENSSSYLHFPYYTKENWYLFLYNIYPDIGVYLTLIGAILLSVSSVFIIGRIWEAEKKQR